MAHLVLLLLLVQAAQVRKSSYEPDPGIDYDPDSYHTNTVYAGTTVRQVNCTSSAVDCLHNMI